MANNPYPRRFEGFEQLPQASSFVIVVNHYNRPGLHPYHCAMAVSAAVARQRPGQPELAWLFTSEWYGVRFGPMPIPVWLIRWLFSRIALHLRVRRAAAPGGAGDGAGVVAATCALRPGEERQSP